MDKNTVYCGYLMPAKAFGVGRQPVAGRRALVQRIGKVNLALGEARKKGEGEKELALAGERRWLESLL